MTTFIQILASFGKNEAVLPAKILDGDKSSFVLQ